MFGSFHFSFFVLVDEVTKNENRLHDFLYDVFRLQGKTGKTKIKKFFGKGRGKKTTDIIYGWYLMLWFAPNDAWDRPHEPIHIVNAFYDGPIGKLKEKCLVGIMKFI